MKITDNTRKLTTVKFSELKQGDVFRVNYGGLTWMKMEPDTHQSNVVSFPSAVRGLVLDTQNVIPLDAELIVSERT